MKSINLIGMCLLLSFNCNSQYQEKNPVQIQYKHTNALVNETSPYLLQHAHNPVDWHPWNEATLKKANTENKLFMIFATSSSSKLSCSIT